MRLQGADPGGAARSPLAAGPGEAPGPGLEAGGRGGWRVLIAAGEASGDSHGAGLAGEVLSRLPGTRFFGMAGPRMKEAGVEPLVELSGVAVVGISEVARHLPAVWSAWRRLVRALEERRPDLVVLIDYPDFNLRLARRAKRLGVPVLYFVSPQVWAWRKGRIRTIGRLVERVMVLFRFEEELYSRAGVPVTWVGHPLAEAAARYPSRRDARSGLGLGEATPVIALLPGSRRAEIRNILPVLLQAAARLSQELPDAAFLLPGAPTLDAGELARACAGGPVRVIAGGLPAVLAAADAAAVASGTATLETALAGVPMVIVYRTSPLTAAIGRRLIRVSHIGLANLVAGSPVAEELVQQACNPARVAAAVKRLLEPPAGPAARRGLELVRRGLGEPGAFRRAADVTIALLERGLPSARSHP